MFVCTYIHNIIYIHVSTSLYKGSHIYLISSFKSDKMREVFGDNRSTYIAYILFLLPNSTPMVNSYVVKFCDICILINHSVTRSTYRLYAVMHNNQ